jgi:hypothetical protein
MWPRVMQSSLRSLEFTAQAPPFTVTEHLRSDNLLYVT